MSVTFGIAGIPSLILVKGEGCDGIYGCVSTQWECGCEYIDGPGVNLSNANATEILGKLDLEALWGSVAVEDLLGRILMAQGTSAPDTGIAGTDDQTPGMARFIDMGRRAGYTEDVLGRLADLCAQAASMGATTIDWG